MREKNGKRRKGKRKKERKGGRLAGRLCNSQPLSVYLGTKIITEKKKTIAP